MHVVLVEPEIPSNTGNIARSCAVTGTHLHLVRPLGFSTEDRYLKRAGLDYWSQVKINYYDSIEEVFQAFAGHEFYLLTTKGGRHYHTVSYGSGDLLVFGKETAGLPKFLLEKYPHRCLRIPMQDGLRSLNMANSVAIVLFEALRQQNFPNLV